MNGKNLVVIKSLKNGLKLILDSEADFEDVLRELGKKCSDGRNFFGNETMAISIEGRELTEIQEIRVLETIHINCNLNVICIIDHDEDMNYKYIKAIKSMQKRYYENTKMEHAGGNFFKGSLVDGEKLEVDYPVVILGDVNSGCSVVSTGSIIVLGSLYGEAVIKSSIDDHSNKSDSIDENDCLFVMAQEMVPEKLIIGDIEYTPSKLKWGSKHKSAQIAYVKGKKIIVDAVNKSTLETLYAL